MFTSRSAAGIEQAGLSEQDERPLWVLAIPDRPFGGADFLQSAAQMKSTSLGSLNRSPGDRPIQGKIYFENTHTIAETRQLPTKTGRQAFASNLQQLARGEIKQECPGRR
jgi:hypothetical protein